MIEMQQVFGLPKELELVDITVVDEVLTISVVSTQMSPCCPLCGVHASRIPSTYPRQMADVPCGGQYVRLLVQVRKRASRRSPQTSPLRTRGSDCHRKLEARARSLR
jgi:hypothetical protein